MWPCCQLTLTLRPEVRAIPIAKFSRCGASRKKVTIWGTIYKPDIIIWNVDLCHPKNLWQPEGKKICCANSSSYSFLPCYSVQENSYRSCKSHLSAKLMRWCHYVGAMTWGPYEQEAALKEASEIIPGNRRGSQETRTNLMSMIYSLSLEVKPELIIVQEIVDWFSLY